MPEDVFGGKTHGEVVTQGTGFFKKLKVAGVDDVVTSGDENAFHGNKVGESGSRGVGESGSGCAGGVRAGGTPTLPSSRFLDYVTKVFDGAGQTLF